MPSESDERPSDEPVKAHIVNYPPGAKTLRPAGWSVLYTMPGQPNEVVKVPLPLEMYEKAHEIERQVYRRLGLHKSLAEVVKMDEYGIYLVQAEHGCIREYYMKGGTATLSERIKWCRELAEVLEYVHQHNVRHADLSGRNLLLDSTRNILLCDFSGSFIDGTTALVIAEAGYRHPDRSEYLQPTLRSEIHSLGSTIYEIVTSTQPHQGLEDYEVDKLLEEGKYPDVSNTPLGDVIAKCWAGEFGSKPLYSLAKNVFEMAYWIL
ncbi:hypothetical protein VTK56DRAFT_5113 [Thermocarpiscus australiensis]